MFPIYGRKKRKITTLQEWFEFAPPAQGKKHWKCGRSAKELARAWLQGGLPQEVRALLSSSEATEGFVPACAWAELKTPLDSLRGNTRNHDLLVHGHDTKGLGLILAIEGKADEGFGKTIEQRLAEVMRKGKQSNVPKRVSQLAQAVLGSTADAVKNLRYQLLFAVAATLIEARTRNARKAVFLVHEFLARGLNEKKLHANATDFESFIRRFSKKPALVVQTGTLYGPYRATGNIFVPSDVDLFIGKTSRTVSAQKVC
jgi:hypothetical protein